MLVFTWYESVIPYIMIYVFQENICFEIVWLYKSVNNTLASGGCFLFYSAFMDKNNFSLDT